jgi:hypothetical protein
VARVYHSSIESVVRDRCLDCNANCEGRRVYFVDWEATTREQVPLSRLGCGCFHARGLGEQRRHSRSIRGRVARFEAEQDLVVVLLGEHDRSVSTRRINTDDEHLAPACGRHWNDVEHEWRLQEV